MTRYCLYCGLQFSDTAEFCPTCGRPTASGFTIRPGKKAEVERLSRELKAKDELIRQLVLAQSLRDEGPRSATHPAGRVGNGDGQPVDNSNGEQRHHHDHEPNEKVNFTLYSHRSGD